MCLILISRGHKSTLYKLNSLSILKLLLLILIIKIRNRFYVFESVLSDLYPSYGLSYLIWFERILFLLLWKNSADKILENQSKPLLSSIIHTFKDGWSIMLAISTTIVKFVARIWNQFWFFFGKVQTYSWNRLMKEKSLVQIDYIF